LLLERRSVRVFAWGVAGTTPSLDFLKITQLAG
jgi:hypothetical protein